MSQGWEVQCHRVRGGGREALRGLGGGGERVYGIDTEQYNGSML